MNRRSFLKFIPYVAALALPIKTVATPRPILPTDDEIRDELLKSSYLFTDTETNRVYKFDETNNVWRLI